MLAAPLRRLAGAGVRVTQALPRDALAEGDRQAAALAAKHLLHQEQHRQGRGDERAGVEERAVMGANKHRQQRGTKLRCQLYEAAVPCAVADPVTGQARYLASGKED